MVPTFTCGLVRSNFAFAIFSSVRSSVKNRARDRARTRDPQLGSLMLYQLSYARAPQSGGGRIRTFVALSAADLQSAPFGRSGTPPRPRLARLPLTTDPACRRARGLLVPRILRSSAVS